MDFQRYLLIAATAVLSLMLLTKWTAFQQEHDPAAPASVAIPPVEAPASIEAIPTDNMAPTESEDLPTSIPETSETAPQTVDVTTVTSADTRQVRVTTDVLDMQIDLVGGDISYAALRQHFAKIDQPDQPFVLLENSHLRTYIAQSGLVGKNGTDTAKGRPLFSSTQINYSLADDQDELAIDLVFKDESNQATIIKRFIFERGNYLVKVQYLVSNHGEQNWSGNFFAQIKRDSSPDPGSDGNALSMSPFLGAATTTADEPYKKLSFEDMAKTPLKAEVDGGWVAMVQHYFLSAWVANPDQAHLYSTTVTRNGFNIIRFTSPALIVAPGQQATIESGFYAGPKDQYKLMEISPGLELSVDYGWLWWIAQPLFALLHFFATGQLYMFNWEFSLGSGTGNWGWSIVLLTLLIKALFFKLSAASYKSMANMRKLQPQMLRLKEQYGDDRQKMSQATMELYKKEKVNPLGGCLPILIQMPVFIALYWTLMESVELRHAPFMFWIKDLSVMDPYYVLPLVMGASMWIQQKLNPAPPDPMQAKVMQMMPIMFTFFFLWFPAGLVLYWVVNNVLSIAQQWVITKRIESAA
jgi:YidC/Oxa1 family membrane protein insertase